MCLPFDVSQYYKSKVVLEEIYLRHLRRIIVLPGVFVCSMVSERRRCWQIIAVLAVALLCTVSVGITTQRLNLRGIPTRALGVSNGTVVLCLEARTRTINQKKLQLPRKSHPPSPL